MIRPSSVILALLVLLASPFIVAARDISPFVSSEWLSQNLDAPGLVVIDVRNEADYRQNHIPKAVNAPVSSWAVSRNSLMRELPADEDLLKLIGSIGLKENSAAVIAGNGGSDFDRADAVRVAWTLLIAGIRDVAVLDGGVLKWMKEKRALTAEKPPLRPGVYSGKVTAAKLASKDYILAGAAKPVLVDGRTPDVYFGVTTEPWALKPGHIVNAVNLPAPWIFQQDGLLKSRTELERMANGVVGDDRNREIIAYCGVGVYASVWSYILTEVLGYEDVKVYDGSMQEWVMDPAGPLAIYEWHRHP